MLPEGAYHHADRDHRKGRESIAAATGTMLTSRNARPTPTAIASMLVAKPVMASNQKPWRAGFSASSSPDAFSAETIMRTPKMESSVKAIQWSHDLT